MENEVYLPSQVGGAYETKIRESFTQEQIVDITHIGGIGVVPLILALGSQRQVNLCVLKTS